MRLKIEDFDKYQEVTIEDLKLYGHFDEQLFCQSLDWCGATVRSGAFGFEIVIEKALMPWQATRLIEIFRRYGFSEENLTRIEGLQFGTTKS